MGMDMYCILYSVLSILMDLTAAWNGETGKLQRQAPETSFALLVNLLTQWNSQLLTIKPGSTLVGEHVRRLQSVNREAEHRFWLDA
jgi:hypothetical protein